MFMPPASGSSNLVRVSVGVGVRVMVRVGVRVRVRVRLWVRVGVRVGVRVRVRQLEPRCFRLCPYADALQGRPG